MHALINDRRAELAALCRRFDVVRLDVFGSAARGTDFDLDRSDADFLVSFAPRVRDNLTVFFDLKDALEALLKRSVDLIDHEAVAESCNYLRRRHILAKAQPIYG